MSTSTQTPTPPMSFESPDDTVGDGRRAAHVKWDGKTIALGTFKAQEAAEKCSRAKALTKKWRTTMIPKPDVEWVKTTLERLNIRVVNDRPGRRKKRGVNEMDQISTASSSPSQHQRLVNNLAQNRDHMLPSHAMKLNDMNPEATFHALSRGAANFQSLGGDASGSNPLQYGNNPSQQRNLSNSVLSSLPNPGNIYNIGNSLSGFEASSNDYQQEQLLSNALQDEQRMGQRSNTTQQQLANLVFGSNQHYEVLKEHHMNLLKELQETTTLMNMYHNTSNNNQHNMDNLGGRNRNQETFDPYLDQSNLLMGGSNQLYNSSPTIRRESFGLGGNHLQRAGMAQLSAGSQFDAQLTNAIRRDSLRSGGNPYSMQTNESRHHGDNYAQISGERKKRKDNTGN